MMLRALVVALTLVACKHDAAEDKKPAPPAAVTAGKVVNGVRHIDVEANKSGYTPDKIAGKPGESLVLVFTRTADSECIAQVKVGTAAAVDLPMNKPVDVAVTVPASGELGFACGMDMFHGVIVAQPAS